MATYHSSVNVPEDDDQETTIHYANPLDSNTCAMVGGEQPSALSSCLKPLKEYSHKAKSFLQKHWKVIALLAVVAYFWWKHTQKAKTAPTVVDLGADIGAKPVLGGHGAFRPRSVFLRDPFQD